MKKEERLKEFKKWLKENDYRLPSRKSNDSIEKSFASWMYKNNDWSPVCRLWGYCDKVKYHKDRIKEIKEFIDKNGREPDINSKNCYEKFLARWLNIYTETINSITNSILSL